MKNRPSIGDNFNLQKHIIENFEDIDSQLNDNTKKITGRISITNWSNLVINKGQSNEDWKDAFQEAVNYLKSQQNSLFKQALVFPAGIYQYSVSPNWAIQGAKILNEGEVRFRYTGTGIGIILDGSTNISPVASNVFDFEFRSFIFEGDNNCTDAVYVDCIHHSKIDVRVMGCSNAGFNIKYNVCTEFWCTVSGNEQGWYKGARPFVGLLLDEKGSGLLPAYCIFHNPIIEATVQGGLIKSTLGNTFFGGTFEGCLDNGLTLSDKAGLNKFYSVDLEANAGNDVVCGGFENFFYCVDTLKMFDFQGTAKNNSLIGGSHKNINLELGSSHNLVDGVKYNRELYDGTTGQLIDSGTGNRLTNNTNVKLNKMENRPSSGSTITLTGSPFTYTNTSGNDERILLFGGTMSAVNYVHGGTGDSLVGYTNQFITLCPGDSLQLTYTVAPTMRKYTT